MEENEIEEFFKIKLGLSDKANFNKEAQFQDVEFPFKIDYIIEDQGLLYIIEMKSKAKINSIAQLVFYREWLKDFPGDKKFILATKRITPMLENIGERMGVEVLEFPYTMKIYESKDSPTKKGKITSDKSWRVISRLLKEKGISIRKLSIKENVSYAWTHATVQNILNRGIATKNGNYVIIKDIPQLLNGIAWERPFEELFYDEIHIGYSDTYQASKDLTSYLKRQNVMFSFTTYTALGQYSGYGRRFDTLYMYIEKTEAKRIKYKFNEETGIKLRLYIPDRNVFKDSKEIDGIQVVSHEQLILDMAGLGYSGRDFTKVLVDEYVYH